MKHLRQIWSSLCGLIRKEDHENIIDTCQDALKVLSHFSPNAKERLAGLLMEEAQKARMVTLPAGFRTIKQTTPNPRFGGRSAMQSIRR